jgi:hypothetical protein
MENVVGSCPPTVEPNVMQPSCEAHSRILLIAQIRDGIAPKSGNTRPTEPFRHLLG